MPNLPQGLGKPGKICRLDDATVRATHVTGDDIALGHGGGEGNHGQETRAAVGADAVEDFKAVELGQIQIEQDDSGLLRGVPPGKRAGGEEIIQSLRPIAHDVDKMVQVVLLKGAQGEQHVVRVVLDEENGFGRGVRLRRGWRVCRQAVAGCVVFQIHRSGRTFTQRAGARPPEFLKE